MSKYKVGQLIKVVDVLSFSNLTLGGIYTILYSDDSQVPVMVKDDNGNNWWIGEQQFEVLEPDTSNVETKLKIEEGIEPLTMEQLAAFVYGYSTAGGDMSKVVTLTFEGDK